MRLITNSEIAAISGGGDSKDKAGKPGTADVDKGFFDKIGDAISKFGEGLASIGEAISNFGAGFKVGSIEVSICTGEQGASTPSTNCGKTSSTKTNSGK